MDKMKLKDGMELSIEEGASLGAITVTVSDFASLDPVATALKAEGSLDSVEFITDGKVTGEYSNMLLETPLFHSVDYTEAGMVQAMFAIRAKTKQELALEELKAGQTLQNDAIADLGEVVSSLSEGGEA